MKYYTLPEHRTFCIESGIPNGEVWNEVAKLGWLPEGIYRNPSNAFDPKQKARVKKYQSTPEYRMKQKVRRSTSEYKAVQRKFRSTPEFRMKEKEYNKRHYWKNKK